MLFLETDRLFLRNVITDDVDIMFEYRNNEICSRYQRGQTKTYDGIEDLVQRRKEDKISTESPFMLAVALKDTNDVKIKDKKMEIDKEYLQKNTQNNMFKNKEIMLKLSDGKTFSNKGAFKYTDNTIDKSSNSIDIYADFKNIGNTLLPNAYVTVLVKEVFNNALKISKEYVLLDTKSVYVYIIRDGKIIRENLNILADNDTFFIVINIRTFNSYFICTNT